MSADKNFKNIINRICRHNSIELSSALMKLAYTIDTKNIEILRYYPPWYILLLLKWTILYGDYNKTSDQKPVTQYYLKELIKRVHELPDFIRPPSKYQNPFLFIRNMAFQQFWLQENFYMAWFAQQYQLFGELNKNHTLYKLFQEETGITIRNFIELSLITVSLFTPTEKVNKPNFINYDIQFEGYSAEIVKSFFNCISINFSDAQNWLKTIEDEKKPSEKVLDYEFYEQSPFRRYPLIKHGNLLWCISPILLQNSMQTFIYDLLRNKDASSFMNKFGNIFENAVEQAFRSLPLEHLFTEDQLKKHFTKFPNQKLIDLLIIDESNNIFVDAKGVAMSRIGMVTHQPGTVRSQSETSVIKGIEQAYALAQTLAQENKIGDIEIGKKDNYLLIVTYKDLYVGNGRVFHELITQDEINKIIAKYGDREWIPLSNMYFISLGDLDILVSCLLESKKLLSQVLQYAVESDKNYKTMKFVFRQHIFEICPEVNISSFLSKILDKLINEMVNKFDNLLL